MKDASPLQSPSPSKRTLRFTEAKEECNKKTTLRFASAKKPSSRQRMSGWNNKPLIFSPFSAHFPLAYKYMYFRLNEGSFFEGRTPSLGFLLSSS